MKLVEGRETREYGAERVFVRFVPAIPGIQRQYIEIVNARRVLCGLMARNIQRALGLPDDGKSEAVEVELILRRKGSE